MAYGSATGGDGADLIGDIGDSGTGESSASAQDGAINAVNQGVRDADGDQDKEADELERASVEKLTKEYEAARDFDKAARIEYAQSRKYAAGLSDPSWASDANLIGSFIDILTSFLYAQNPDVSARPAENAGEQPQPDQTAFADTAEIIISKLWKLAKLKTSIRRVVRSALSVGVGWGKGLMWSKQRPMPQVEKELHDAEAQMARLEAAKAELNDPEQPDMKLQQEKIRLLQAGLQKKLMLAKEFGFNVDYVRAEDMQVSLDVSATEDYVFADWLAEDLYIPKESLRARFTRLSQEDEKSAVVYYQKNIPANAKGDVLQMATGEEAADGSYSKTVPSLIMGGAKPVQFVKVIEFWDRRDSMIKTMVEGVKKWAVEPYSPPQATTRFYPYFRLSFFEVDGHRHPQSLSWRLKKLQDEYNAARSNQRLTRERSIPGILFNSGLVPPEEAKRLEDAVIGEMLGLKLTDINMPIQNALMAKPVPPVDVKLWDTTAIRQDMEALSGVQEAMQQAISQQPKTATEAQIQQTGFASRTSADRDLLEDMLGEIAKYTLETGIQEIDGPGAQRIAGPKAFWPAGMDVQDLLTMVDVDITAGTTGKPNLAADKANWATILPLLQKLMVQIRQLQSSDPPLAEAMENLLRESLHRMDDRLDISEFIPTEPPPPPPPPTPPPPSVSVSLKGELPPLDAAAIGAQAAGLPPEAAALAEGGAPPTAMAHAGIPGPHSADEEGNMPIAPHLPQPLPAAAQNPHEGGKPKA